MKSICINPVFMALQGNFNAQDVHGHKETLRFRETAWGTKSFGLGSNAKRNLTTNPLSPLETAHRQAFADAAALRSKILSTSSLRQTWQSKFKEDKKDGLTACNTLTGYLMQTAMNGGIDEDGNAI